MRSERGSFGFQQMVYEMPSKLVDVCELVKEAGHSDEMLRSLYRGGVQRVPVCDGRPIFNLVRKAIDKLALVMPDFPQNTAGFLFAHSVPLLAPSSASFLSLCLEEYDVFASIPRVAISGQPCAILHTAVQFAGNWLNDFLPGEGILLIGADQAYSAEDRIFFGSAMGDVAVAMFVDKEAGCNRVLSSVSECNVMATAGEESPPEDIAQFRNLNALFIRHAIESCLSNARIALGQLSFIVPHTPYTTIWDTIAELLDYPRERILTNYLSETGHLNSNDSFVHYIRAVNEGIICRGDLALLVNPGFGGTRGCTLLRR